MPVSGKKSGHFAFYIKESRRIFFSFYSSFRLTIRPLSRLEKRSPEFSTERERRFFVWKKRGKLRFSTVCRRSPAESAPHAVFAPECVRNRAIACVPSCSVPSKKNSLRHGSRHDGGSFPVLHHIAEHQLCDLEVQDQTAGIHDGGDEGRCHDGRVSTQLLGGQRQHAAH